MRSSSLTSLTYPGLSSIQFGPHPKAVRLDYLLHRLGGYAMSNLETEQPVSGRERIYALDVLRGFAMLGVLVAYCMWSLGTAPDWSWSALNRWLGSNVVPLVIDFKFYTILAFLFGLGFSIQLARASDDEAAVETYCRRLAVLAGIGLVHALLLRNGDILLPYALTGFLLIPFRRVSARTLIISAFAVLALETAIRALWPIVGLPVFERPHLESVPYLVENAAWVRYWYETAPFNWPTNLTLFLFGFCAGRAQLLTRLERRPRALTLILAGGLAAGIAIYFARLSFIERAGSSPLNDSIATTLFTFHCWGMSSAYAATLLLIMRSKVGAAAVSPLAVIGKLALTNYLLQSVIAVPVCLAFGLFDTFTPTRSLLFAAAILAVELPFSLLWEKRFRFGPAEWLWRVLTYQRLPSMLKTRGDLAN